MKISGVNILSIIDGAVKDEYIDSPSLHEAVNIIHKLDISTESTAIYFLKSNTSITITSAEQNRIFIQWAEPRLVACLLDSNLLDSSERIETSDYQGGPFHISKTVARNEGIRVLRYFFETGKFPKDSLWNNNMKDRIE